MSQDDLTEQEQALLAATEEAIQQLFGSMDTYQWWNTEVSDFLVVVPAPTLRALDLIDEDEAENAAEKKEFRAHNKRRRRVLAQPDLYNCLLVDIERIAQLAWSHGYATAKKEHDEEHPAECTCCPVHGVS